MNIHLPVYYAFAQVKFDAIANIERYIPDLQTSLKAKGYDVLYKNIESDGVCNWFITKSDRKSGFIINQSSVNYHSTHYENRDDFFLSFIEGVEVAHHVVSLTCFRRIAVRNLYAILPEGDGSISRCLVDNVLSIPFGKALESASSRFVFKTDAKPLVEEGSLIIQTHKFVSPLRFPQDLQPTTLYPLDRFRITNPVNHIVIDIDHFVLGKVLPDCFHQLDKQLESLDGQMQEAFYAITTQDTRQVMV